MKIYITCLICLAALSSFARNTSRSSSQLDLLSGQKKIKRTNKTIWDAKYNKKNYVYGKTPAQFLAENFDYIPANSRILDIGIGEGRNAIFLAKKKHEVVGIDISSVAIKKAQLLAKENDVRIETVVGTINKYKFKEKSFDAIICFYLVDRELNKMMIKWLKPGGILIYEAYTLKEKKNNPQVAREANNTFLKSSELLNMFPSMKILKYEEPLHQKTYKASIILQKK